MTLNDFEWLEWPFYVVCSLFTNGYWWLIIYLLLIFRPTVVCLTYTCDQRMWPAEKCEKRSSKQWSAEYLESAEKLRIFHGCYVVGILTNKTKAYPFSTDSKTRDFKWPCTTMFGALKHGFRSFATLKLVVNVVGECRRRTLNQKEQLWHRLVSLRQHSFLVALRVKNFKKYMYA